MKKLSLLICLVLTQLGISQNRLEHASLSDLGLGKAAIHQQVDSLMQLGISEKAFPGAQVLLAKDNKVVFHEAYGFHTYDSIQAVGLDDIYDLASVTKITAPLPALMKLVDEQKLDLDTSFSNYWRPWSKKKDKKNLTLREILSHQAGLTPYIVFLNRVMKNGKFKDRFVRTKASPRFQKQIYEGLYVKNLFQRKMFRIINRSKVSSDKTYKYSGLSFLIYPELISQLTGMDYESYLQKTFYEPLGCHTLGFNPALKKHSNKIVPTEIDSVYRQTLVQSWVHDENASLLGGISGNAGLFGTAKDLAKIMLFYQNMGTTLDGQQIISKSTVAEFIKVQFPENENRRGLGFDKPLLGNDTLNIEEAYPSPQVSPKSFGHSGFTGIFVWADPENQLVFIFLSNRVYPSRAHRKLYELNLRTKLQDIFYTALAN